ncbi:MAG: DNA-3-methyladenine glycosylase 2 family protein, partial [Gammaproteobacteria bacterium]|nr:DNA-3-methyladenine glycosylase 2 family protein [Gammaproteobacteria bacterium]
MTTNGAVSTARLPFEPPLDWAFFLAFHRARALPGVEVVEGEDYRRVVRVGDYLGRMSLTRVAVNALELRLAPADDRALAALLPRVRRAFDLDTTLAPIVAHLGQDAALAPLVAAR